MGVLMVRDESHADFSIWPMNQIYLALPVVRGCSFHRSGPVGRLGRPAAA